MIDTLKKRSVLLICTMFITTLISKEFLAAIGLETSFVMVFLMAAAAVILIEFITYNVKTILISLGILAFGIFINYVIYVPLFSEISYFISSIIDQLYNKIFWADRAFFISELTSIFMICLIVGFSVHFLYTKAQSTIFSLMGFMTYIFSLQFFFGLEKSDIYFLSFSSMIVVLILWIYKNFDRARMLKSYKIWFKYMTPVVSVLLVLTFIFSSLVNIEENEKIIDWINNLFVNALPKGNNTENMFFLDGFEKSNGVIGGDVEIKHKFQFDLTVESLDASELKSGSFYLKGVSCDTFDAKKSKWEAKIDDGGKRLIEDNLIVNRFFGSDVELIFYDNFLSREVGYTQTQKYSIKKQNQDEKTLFYPSMLYSIDTNPLEDIFYDKSGYIHIDESKKIDSYSGLCINLNRDENFNKYVNGFKGDYSEDKGEIDKVVRTALENYYLQVPAEIPASVKELADKITEGYESDYAKVSAIERYMKANYEYTLKPGKVPKDKDIVSYFLLENKKGYCTYYATAMTMLCRSVGIPARYVRGYRIDNIENNKTTSVYSGNLHAWVEVYIYRFGWITFDPVTSGGNSTVPGPSPTTSVSQPSQSVTPTPTETATETVTDTVTTAPTNPATSSSTKVPDNKTESKVLEKILVIAGIIIIVVVLIILGLLVRKRMLYLKNEKKTPAELFERFLRVKTYEGYKWDEGETVAMYFAKFKDSGYDNYEKVFEKCFYAEGCLTDVEYTEIMDLLKELEKNAADRDGKLKWYRYKRNYKININRLVIK